MKHQQLLPAVLIVFLSTFFDRTDAQQSGDADSVGMNTFVRKVELAYSNPDFLQFQVKYRYANERRPDLFIDSLGGEVEMSKGQSRTVIDGVETILTGQYAIQVMPEYKAMYLSAAKGASMQNPLPMLDSLLSHMTGVKVSMRHEAHVDLLTLTFPQGHPYSRLEMAIDANTGYFLEVDYWLNTTGLVGQEMVDRPGHPARYQGQGRIEILFTDYRRRGFDGTIFREDNFFTHTAGRYEPVGRYKDYHIYLASSNL